MNIHRNPSPYRPSMRALVVAASFGALAVMNLTGGGIVRRSLQEGVDTPRALALKTYFLHESWDRVWESIYAGKHVYNNMGPEAAPADPSTFKKNIGYVLPLFHCPGDEDYKTGFDTQFDPEHAFYDAAALLKYSIERNTYPAGSKYNATMYAVVHPHAVRCKGRNGIEYDRVKVLHDLEYHVAVLGDTIRHVDIGDSFVRENIDSDAGLRDFTRLHAYGFDKHPVVVMVDFRSFVVQPSDILFDLFLASDKVISFPMDYPKNPPSNGQNMGASLNFVAIKPDANMMQNILDSYTSTTYDPKWGWNYQAIRDFDGVLGLSGYLHHYFTRVRANSIFSMLDRCTYANAAESPMFVNDAGGEGCRDPNFCDDCRTFDIDQVFVYKMGGICGAPWECHYDTNWPALTKTTCETRHKAWYTQRAEYEKNVWVNGPPPERTGTYHADVFLGYCNCEGPSCYEVMINDKP